MTLKLEAGRFYKRRDGEKAWVIAVGNPMCGDADSQVIGWSDGACGWTLDGTLWDDGTQSEYDLIAEWTEEPEPTPPGNYAVFNGVRYLLTEVQG